MKKFEYKFVPLEILKKENDDVTAIIQIDDVNELGKQGFDLFYVMIMNDTQYGWFKREYDD